MNPLAELFRFLSIILISMAAAVIYGLIHDQITIRIAPEYFTVFHPQILPIDFPLTAVALVWGVIATWWVGLILGIVLACASRLGKRPKLSPLRLVRPIFKLLIVMALCAMAAGCIGRFLMVNHWIVASPEIVDILNGNSEKILGVVIDGFTHITSYITGFIGGGMLAVWAWRVRAFEGSVNPASSR